VGVGVYDFAESYAYRLDDGSCSRDDGVCLGHYGRDDGVGRAAGLGVCYCMDNSRFGYDPCDGENWLGGCDGWRLLR
jgi:hypothetical protein